MVGVQLVKVEEAVDHLQFFQLLLQLEEEEEVDHHLQLQNKVLDHRVDLEEVLLEQLFYQVQEIHHQLVRHKEILEDKVLEQEQMEVEEEVELE